MVYAHRMDLEALYADVHQDSQEELVIMEL